MLCFISPRLIRISKYFIRKKLNIKVLFFVQTGRKKKSAVAKLAERKRRGSECGSELGSVISLHREVDNKEKTTDEPHKESGNSSGKNQSRQLHKGVNNDEVDNAVPDVNTSSVKSGKFYTDIDNINKETPPKPIPRKLNRRRPDDKNPFTTNEIEDGTVVSIYEKREKSPARRAKRDKSPVVKTNKDGTDKDSNSFVKQDLNKSANKDHNSNPFSFLGSGKPRTGLLPLDGSSDGGTTHKRKNNGKSSPVPMDLDDDSDNENKNDPNVISKNAPSDATVHRFRAMRMTPDRSRSEESLKNAAFAPKPPATPRSARRASSKGEKRNRESNSSGEEADKETKKQNSENMEISESILNSSLSNLQPAVESKMDVDDDETQPRKPVAKKGLSLHPNVKEVTDVNYTNVNQNMHDPGDVVSASTENVKKTSSSDRLSSHEESSPEKSPSNKLDMFELSPEKELVSDDSKKSGENSGKKSDKKRVIKRNKVKPIVQRKELKPLDGSEETSPAKSTLETLGSASDLQAISEKYQEVLDNSPTKSSDNSQQSPSRNVQESVIPEPKAKTGKLDPIQPKSFPPPLPHDMKSVSLRTQYKNDSTMASTAMNKFFGRSFSGSSEKGKYELLSARSLSASSALPVVSTREARDRYSYYFIWSVLCLIFALFVIKVFKFQSLTVSVSLWRYFKVLKGM